MVLLEFEKHKILVLHEYFDNTLSFPNVVNASLYVERRGWRKMAFRIHEHISERLGKEIWLGRWKNDVCEYDTFIIMDGGRGGDAAEFIQKNNPNARIIVYYLNPVNKGDRKAPDHYKGLNVEFYSFDPKDAEEWGIIYKDFCYSYCPKADIIRHRQKKIKQDIFFVGVDKGRLSKILEIDKKIKQAGLTSKYHIAKTVHTKYTIEQERYVTDRYLTYDEIMNHIMESNCILEFRQAGQHGITLRPMEAMFLQKKLITDDKDIINFAFYVPENILIYDEATTAEDIKLFLDIPYRNVSSNIVDMYRPINWLNSFFEDKCVKIK